MRLPRRPALWLAGVVFYTLLTFGLSSLPGTDLLPEFKLRVDLVLHAVEYGVLAWLALRYLSLAGARPGRWTVAWGTLLFCGAVGGLNELWQGHIPGRYLSLTDEVANLVGAAVVIWWYRTRIAKAHEHRY